LSHFQQKDIGAFLVPGRKSTQFFVNIKKTKLGWLGISLGSGNILDPWDLMSSDMG
jgi:hypothetical protein